LTIATGDLNDRCEQMTKFWWRSGSRIRIWIRIGKTDLHEIFREGWQWAKEEVIKF